MIFRSGAASIAGVIPHTCETKRVPKLESIGQRQDVKINYRSEIADVTKYRQLEIYFIPIRGETREKKYITTPAEAYITVFLNVIIKITE